ncbi:HMG box protein [Colletotrichum scovillei]|uniref:HMG box protein n=1 Tax=Colletotrichum scovillei TaxID=1209932 RepID=A0A9P7R8F9_9PEZI|nr:HMG box protein [Colletotrichum scovillei]KAF4782340.1 HMG box protein [Colletotrichum scovillei]KAG7050414.1 HMG box protein [Colletotrichum scovillei]KAG7069455.1 HMG box protein [Colletotrichum scovillei]KAG7073403.1 HMG box protein [Colletotrichum scovillei]
MLTAIGRAAAQRVLLRTAPLAVPRTQLAVVRAASCRGFATSQWARMPATKAATTTKTKTKTTAAKKKPATKAKKPAAKKPKAKKKVAVKKAAPKKKKVKKVVLTPEQQKRLRVRELKAAALLEEPKKLPTNTFRVYAEQQFATEPTSDLKLTDRVKGIAESYKNLSSYEVQRLEETAEANKLTNNAAYKSWVESLQPTVVAEANRARLRLRNLTGKQVPRTIRDDRLPKRPHNAYALFVKARFGSGDYSNHTGKASENMQAIGNEWKQMSPPEKIAYEELAKADFDRWERESLEILGHVVKRSPSPE